MTATIIEFPKPESTSEADVYESIRGFAEGISETFRNHQAAIASVLQASMPARVQALMQDAMNRAEETEQIWRMLAAYADGMAVQAKGKTDAN